MLPVSTSTDQEGTVFVHEVEEDDNVVEEHTEDHKLPPVLEQLQPHSSTTSPPSDESTTIYETMLPVSTSILVDISDFDQEGTVFVHEVEEDDNVVQEQTQDHNQPPVPEQFQPHSITMHISSF